MDKKHDVIVVGAGPSGATTATILAQQGHSVLLLDRFSFPRDKVCGDGVPSGVIKIMNRYGMEEKIRSAAQQGAFNLLTQARLVSPKGYELSAPLEPDENGERSYVAPRMVLDAIIQQQAVESGVEFCQAQVQAPLIENGRVVGVSARVGENGTSKNIDLHSQLVIGADGVTSVIARNLRPKKEKHKPKHRAVALRAYIDDITEIPNTAEFFLYKEISPGYAWIFSMGNNRANIGLGMRLDHFRKSKRKLEDMLQDFLGLPDIKMRLQRGGQLHDIATWQLSFGSQKGLRFAFDGAMLVGDAAGFINPITGGGIHNGMISAELAAQTAHMALMKGDPSLQTLQQYEQQCAQELWPGLRRSYNFQRIFLRFPALIDFLIQRGRKNNQLTQTFLSKL